MKAICVEPVGIRASDGKQIVRAFVLADAEPATLPTSGAGIEGMTAQQVFAPLSTLFILDNDGDKVFVANESGAFVAQ